jgi:hypothetical protein
LIALSMLGGCATPPQKRASFLNKPESSFSSQTGPSEEVIKKYYVCDEKPASPTPPKDEEIDEKIETPLPAVPSTKPPKDELDELKPIKKQKPLRLRKLRTKSFNQYNNCDCSN